MRNLAIAGFEDVNACGTGIALVITGIPDHAFAGFEIADQFSADIVDPDLDQLTAVGIEEKIVNKGIGEGIHQRCSR